MRRSVPVSTFVSCIALLCSVSTRASAAEPLAPSSEPSTLTPPPQNAPTAGDETAATEPRKVSTHEAPPVLLYTWNAYGAPARTLGAHSVVGGATESVRPVRGEFTVYGSPIDHLTLLATAGSRPNGEWAPAVTAAARILGSREDGWALGASGSFKAEGFGEVEGELEAALLFSVQSRRLHADVNAVLGGGLEEEEEHDVEGKLRLAYDVASWAQLGIDGRFRHRLGGPKALVGGRNSDVATGAEFRASTGRFYAAALAGVSTVDVASGASPLGWLGVGVLVL